MANVKDPDLDINAPPPSADQLRMALLEEQMKEVDKQAKAAGASRMRNSRSSQTAS